MPQLGRITLPLTHTAYFRLNVPVAVAASASLQEKEKNAINVAARKYRIRLPDN